MTAITRDYYCTACRRVHRIVSLVGQAHKTFNEWVNQPLRSPVEPVTGSSVPPVRASDGMAGSIGDPRGPSVSVVPD